MDDITVKTIEPERAGFDTRPGEPLATLDRHLGAAESAWHRLDRNPADTEARRDYNFAVARVCSTVSKTKLSPWTTPVRAGTRTLAWCQVLS